MNVPIPVAVAAASPEVLPVDVLIPEAAVGVPGVLAPVLPREGGGAPVTGSRVQATVIEITLETARAEAVMDVP